MDRQTLWRLGILAALGAVVIGASFMLQSVATHAEVLAKDASVSQERPLTFTFRAAPSERVTVHMQFKSFAVDSQLQPVINEEASPPFTNVSSQVIQVKDDNLQTVNQLVLREVSGVGGLIIVDEVRVQRVPGYVSVVHVLLNIVGVTLLIGPWIFHSYRAFRHRQELEVKFPAFLRDVVEGMHAGMPLPRAIIATQDNEYGALSPYVRSIAAKIEWGVPFDTILSEFAQKTRSTHIQRSVNAVIHAHRTGGAITEILEAISTNLRSFQDLRQERKHQMYGEILTGYVIYVVFVVILASIITYLLPALVSTGQLYTLQGGGTNIDVILGEYRVLFRNLAILQAVFSGSVIGKLSEGTFSAGGKHMVILGSIGYAGLVLFI